MRICLFPPSHFRNPLHQDFNCLVKQNLASSLARLHGGIAVKSHHSFPFPHTVFIVASCIFIILDGLHEPRNWWLCHTLYRSFICSFIFCFTLRKSAYFPGHISSQHMPFVFRHHRNRLYFTFFTTPISNIFIYQ